MGVYLWPRHFSLVKSFNVLSLNSVIKSYQIYVFLFAPMFPACGRERASLCYFHCCVESLSSIEVPVISANSGVQKRFTEIPTLRASRALGAEVPKGSQVYTWA